jgi:hypothetical protein
MTHGALSLTCEEPIDDLMTEVKATVKILTINKAPGADSITTEVIEAEGETSVDIMHVEKSVQLKNNNNAK